MNPFNKNPFVSNTNTKIVGNKINFDEKQKIENIKEKMAKLKYKASHEVPENTYQPSVKEKIENLKNIDRWK